MTSTVSRWFGLSAGLRLFQIRRPSGWVYAAFVIDVLSRMVVGRQVSTSLCTDLPLDASEVP
ncbi:hypothetical protein [Spongiactinospora rosea]|uniref:hypothetical protein n=1 Tax=Spongiactinospora rosea TaxID=2248750 RepID=UPI000DEBAC72|nr:hypothetical protein [Spongiactinospora rosea]